MLCHRQAAHACTVAGQRQTCGATSRLSSCAQVQCSQALAAPVQPAAATSSKRGFRVAAAKQQANVRHGNVVAKPDMKFGVVVGRFNDLVTKLLLEGAYNAFQSHGVDLANVEVCWVPGSFELPVVAKAMAKSSKLDAVVCIGVVVRGATTHYDAVVSAATSGVLNASVDTGTAAARSLSCIANVQWNIAALQLLAASLGAVSR
eukprot:GHRR01033274.1.p1 GENE.GHRR01033274.1~~GHRR01033274.1.p1  ORF type:complete len:204 (+),score=74.46 GHRR01033274.1:27-638(+)